MLSTRRGKGKLINSNNPLYKTNKTIIMLPFCIILMNIKLFEVGPAIKPAHFIVGIIILNAILKKFKVNNLIVSLFYILVPLLSLSNIMSLKEFVQTFAIYIMSCFLLLISLQYYKDIDKASLKKMFIIFFRAFNLTVIYGIIQFLLANIFKNTSLYNNLGVFQYHPHYDNRLYGFYRAASIYIEPSVFAWVCTTVFVILYYLRNNEIIKKEEYIFTEIMCISGVIVAISASGFLGSILIFLSILLTKNRSKEVVTLIVAILALSMILIFTYPEFFDFLRLDEIMHKGTSGYGRFGQPLLAMMETIKMYPLTGRGLGQIGVYNPELQYNIAIHNSLFGVFITFGMSALLYIIPIMYNTYKYILNDKNTLTLFVNIFYVFITTGSFLSLEIPVIYCLIVLAISYQQNNEII